MATKTRKQRADALSYVQGKTLVKIKIDKNFLKTLVLYIFTKSRAITRANLQICRKLFDALDMKIYSSDAESMFLIEFIKLVLDCKLVRGVERKSIIFEVCRSEFNTPMVEDIINMVNTDHSLSVQEIRSINKQLSVRLEYIGALYQNEIIKDVAYRLDMNDFESMEDFMSEYRGVISNTANELRKARGTSSGDIFSLKDEVVDFYMQELVKDLMDPKRIYKTGIRQLNAMLSPGFMPKRLYLFLGLTGGYKSSMLLQCARWIKLYNKPTPRRKDPTSTPTVLLITTENSVQESVVRLFNMSVSDTPITEYTAETAIKELKTTGKMVLKDTTDTDIMIVYYANNELDTSDLYGIIEDIEDDNREVVALIFDYIKRIRPAEPAPDERLQLKNVSNELKTLAIRLDIPVITANQINRSGNMAIDAAIGEGREDLGRLLGRGNIAVSWDLLENVDWAAIINMERGKRDGIMYLTINRIKIRYKDLAKYPYINHPFVPNSTIQLVDDIMLDSPVSKESLASDNEGITGFGVKGKSSYGDRDVVSSKREEVGMDEFDFGSAMYGSD